MRALLTGGTHGIGEATARGLCPLVDVLLLHGPDRERDVRPLLDELGQSNPGTELVYLRADYGRLAEVGELATAVREHVDGLELLINNAGRPAPTRRTLTTDGHETTFQTNFLAPVGLTSGLRSVLERGTGARVINVASATHYSARLDLDDLELEHAYTPVAAYARSKLALVTYTCWLAHEFNGSGVEAVSVHPGVISTGLLHAMFSTRGDSVDHGARNVLALVRHPAGINGWYFDEDTPTEPNPRALDPAFQERLIDATADALRDAGVSISDAQAARSPRPAPRPRS